MRRRFNTTGSCNPKQHYMVNMDSRLAEIREMVAYGDYFTINRARQYGKTTLLRALGTYLEPDYIVVGMDFQFFTHESFRDERAFVSSFTENFLWALQGVSGADENVLAQMQEEIGSDTYGLTRLFYYLRVFCSRAERPVVLLIDEVDSASNNQVFLDFLGLLRGCYLHRDRYETFQSVILAGVYDIKRLKDKIRLDETGRNNSPWNIAADFNVDMSFHVTDIQGMLAAYEQDYHTGMALSEMAQLLYDYTSGYPFLVSRLCKLLDEQVAGRIEGYPDKTSAWTKAGFLEAVKLLLAEKNTLFESLINKVNDYPELRQMLQVVLFSGNKVIYNPDHEVFDIAAMFGFVKNQNGALAVANRIFETRLYNLFLSEEELHNRLYTEGAGDRNQFVHNGMLDMDLVMQKFMEHWNDLYAGSDEKFIEDNGRKFFLLYLKPIINGTGNYYVEAQTRDQRRTDVIVDYRGVQFIIEIKIWRGEEYNQRGEQQLAEYLDAYHATKGYLLSFNFNKNKCTGMKEILCGTKTLLEVVV